MYSNAAAAVWFLGYQRLLTGAFQIDESAIFAGVPCGNIAAI
jgi:hypothetical protein